MAEFKESEHPRDKDGKFTDKGTEHKSRIKRLRENFERRKQRKAKSRVGRLIEKRKSLKIELQFFAEKALENQTIEELESGIKKVQKRKQEHEAKIANPQLYCKDWQKRNEYAKAGLIVFWKKEIAHFNQQIKDRESEIKKRGKR